MQIDSLRRQFPALNQRINGQPLTWLDSAATTQKPASVIAAIQQFYRRDNANVHRGVHQLSDRATDAYETARVRMAEWLKTEPEQVVWTSGTTAGINMLAYSLGMTRLEAGDQILVSALEHHANLLPWQQVVRVTGAELRIIPIDAEGTIDLQAVAGMLNERVKLVAFSHLSNVLGTVQPVQALCNMASEIGAITVVDGAQAVAHLSPQPEALGCDFYLFSGHKMYGPTGIGVLWGKRERLEQLPPWQTGGEMVRDVSYQDASFTGLPHRLEAGTPNIVGVIGLAAAVAFIQQQDWQTLMQHEQQLLEVCRADLEQLTGVKLLPYSDNCSAVVGFTVDGHHPADVAQWLDHCGIAVRAGHHCAQPLHDRLGLTGSVRTSFGCYSTFQDIEKLVAALRSLIALPKQQTEISDKSKLASVFEQAKTVHGWEATYQFLLKLAKEHPQTDFNLRKVEHQVSGCDSRTWVRVVDGNVLKLDSESGVVKGLLVIVSSIAALLPANEWQQARFMSELEQLDLLPFVSETRVNGISAVLKTIEDQALAASS